MRTEQYSGQYRDDFRDTQACHHHSPLHKDADAADAQPDQAKKEQSAATLRTLVGL
jgi:hypothetical protein